MTSVQALNNELEKKLANGDCESATRIAELEAKIADLTSQNANLRNELTVTATDLASLRQAHLRPERGSTQSAERVNELEAKLAMLSDHNAQLKAELNVTAEELASLKQTHAAMEKKLAAGSEPGLDLEAKIADLTSQNHKLKSELTHKDTELMSLKRKRSNQADDSVEYDLASPLFNALLTTSSNTSASSTQQSNDAEENEMQTEDVATPANKTVKSEQNDNIKSSGPKISLSQLDVNLTKPTNGNDGKDQQVAKNLDSTSGEALASSSNQASSSGGGNSGSQNETHPQYPSVLNPVELTKKVRFHLGRLGLRFKDLAPYLNVTSSVTSHLLNDKAPWAKLSEEKRNQYRAMHIWLVEHEHKKPDQVVVPVDLFSNPAMKAPLLRAAESAAKALEEVSDLVNLN
jgi:uncharacterized small protein (DUF1192 family)